MRTFEEIEQAVGVKRGRSIQLAVSVDEAIKIEQEVRADASARYEELKAMSNDEVVQKFHSFADYLRAMQSSATGSHWSVFTSASYKIKKGA